MNAAELLQELIAHGANASGINDRFMGDAELYKSCFEDFLEEPNLAELERDMQSCDYVEAFSPAHALKGLSGNLGLTGFYDAICVLVESLRAGNYATVAAEYEVARHELARLRAIASGEQPAPKAAENAAALQTFMQPEGAKKLKPEGKRDNALLFSILALVALFVFIALTSFRLLSQYQTNIAAESANHLVELNAQLELYIEEKIDNDWRVAHSVGNSVMYSNFEDDDESVMELMRRQCENWGATDLMLYTANGYAICADGEVQSNDIASDMIARAREEGEYLSIIESELIYTIPIDTQLRYRGSRVVAVSVVQSMADFLDSMGFSSFGGAAWMHLTEENGVIISTLTNPSARSAYNISALFLHRDIEPIGDTGVSDPFMAEEPTAFLLSDGSAPVYLVSTAISTHTAPLRLFYFAPERVVNATMNSFSRQLTLRSLYIVIGFGVLALFSFIFIYRTRKLRFNAELRARERMFDLLIKNTRTAFGLFTVNSPEPVYSSGNVSGIIGEQYLTLDRTEEGFGMHGVSGGSSVSLDTLNARLRLWDGKNEFKSGYIKNDMAVPPTYYEIRLYPADTEGNSFVGIAQDVTQDYQREATVKNALAMAESANDAKSRFLSNMSHDIRTPMNAIMNMTNFALESTSNPKQLGFYLHTIRESSEHLLRLINDVLDMSRIESGQTQIETEPFDIRVEIQRQVDIVRPLCAAKSQTIIADFDRLGAAAVCGDRLKFSQIIMNLLSNAIKFTPPKGAVRLTAEEIPSLREDIADMRFIVEDNGIGISKEYIKHIFEPFSRADDKRVSRLEGTGLGLSICHSYVTAMGGTIQCESEYGEGTVFTVELFFQKAESAPVEEKASLVVGEKPFLGKRCLVAEDNGVNQTIARTMLERLGFIVDIVSDGAEAVQKFRRSRSNVYDIIYMDIQMPVMDGYQAAVAIRECDHPQAKEVPIVAMTANVFAEDIEKARIAGMDGYLGKPIMSLAVVEETEKALHKRKEK